jgi:acyl carrier protein
VFALEERFSIRLDEDEIAALDSAAACVAVVERLHAA